MKHIFLGLLFVLLLSPKISAETFTAPTVPNAGAYIFPEEPENFTDGLMSILSDAMPLIRPAIVDAAAACAGLVGVAILMFLFGNMPGGSKHVIQSVAALSIAGLLLQSSKIMIQLAINTIVELSQYGKLLFPILTAAVAAQGGTSTSVALYVGTSAFDAVLCAVIQRLIIPMIQLYICLSVASAAIEQDFLKKLRDNIKWIMTWILKTLLYTFVGYMSITGVISGTTDAAALRAAKLTLSSIVPVVGGILSDASEAILVGTNVVKSTTGVYGLLAILSVLIGPFITIGAQYLLLKLSCLVCSIFTKDATYELIDNFSTAMGFLLAVTGSVCLLLIVGTVCFMKGVG